MASKNTSEFLSKMEVANIWGFNQIKAFVRVAKLEVLQNEIGWEKGNQLFSPAQVRKLLLLFGEPLQKSELKPLPPKKEE